MARTLYTDQETEQLITQIRQKDPDFNISAFFKLSLINNLQKDKKEEESVDVLQKQLSDLKRQEDQLKSDKEFIEDQLIKAKVKQARKEEEKDKVYELNKSKEARAMHSTLEYIKTWFETKNQDIEQLAQEFLLSTEKNKNLHVFMREHGLKEKEDVE